MRQNLIAIETTPDEQLNRLGGCVFKVIVGQGGLTKVGEEGPSDTPDGIDGPREPRQEASRLSFANCEREKKISNLRLDYNCPYIQPSKGFYLFFVAQLPDR